MPTVDTKELISVSDAGKIGVSALVKAAERGEQRVLMRNNKPIAAVIGIDALERTEELEERLLDLALALSRLLTTDEHRHSLDDVLEHFGFAREDLDAGSYEEAQRRAKLAENADAASLAESMMDLFGTRKERKAARRKHKAGARS